MYPYSFTFLSIATGKYKNYLLKCIESYRILNITEKIQWMIFTDDIISFEQTLKSDSLLTFTFVEIQSLGWPDATLLRYEIFTKSSTQILGENIAYLDADMRFIDRPSFFEPDWPAQASLVLTRHPGYYLQGAQGFLLLLMRSPKTLIRLVKIRIIEGGLGTWERHKTSQAFLKRAKRKTYVCGGFWFGERERVLSMCKILSQRTRKDISERIIARFHDESHLNWYLSNYSDIQLLSPENCFAEDYPNLVRVKKRIIAIEKSESHF